MTTNSYKRFKIRKRQKCLFFRLKCEFLTLKRDWAQLTGERFQSKFRNPLCYSPFHRIVCRYPDHPFIPTIPLPRPSRYSDHPVTPTNTPVDLRFIKILYGDRANGHAAIYSQRHTRCVGRSFRSQEQNGVGRFSGSPRSAHRRQVSVDVLHRGQALQSCNF
uniref:Uncharacterized protein n=1 Tax=Romanomermis culicivorax TaxID=13658 RepID=A0A915HHM1_ROMCU